MATRRVAAARPGMSFDVKRDSAGDEFGFASDLENGFVGTAALGVPEIAIALTVVVLGKAGFNQLKSRLFGSLKETLLPDQVSRLRYHAGLFLLLIPILFGWLSPYLYESASDLMEH